MNKVYLGQVGLPSEAVSIILSVDWLLDRLPTFSTSTIIYHLDHFNRTLSPLSQQLLPGECKLWAWQHWPGFAYFYFLSCQVPHGNQRFGRFHWSWHCQPPQQGHIFSLSIFTIYCPFVSPKEAANLEGLVELGRSCEVRFLPQKILRNFAKPLRKASLQSFHTSYHVLIAHHHYRRNCCGWTSWSRRCPWSWWWRRLRPRGRSRAEKKRIWKI